MDTRELSPIPEESELLELCLWVLGGVCSMCVCDCMSV